MSKDDQSAWLMIIVVVVTMCLVFDALLSAGKAWNAFYHQVILKDQVVGKIDNSK